MKNLILVSLILQLLITINVINATFIFGDILSFLRACSGKKGLYKHHAIYVGPSNENDVGQGDNDIFHLTGCKGQVCQYQFDKLEATKEDSPVEVDNYLDKTNRPGTKEEIMKRIKDSKGTCELKDCEHFAAWVRYDKPTAKESGSFFHRISAFAKKIMKKIGHDVMNDLDCLLAE